MRVGAAHDVGHDDVGAALVDVVREAVELRAQVRALLGEFAQRQRAEQLQLVRLGARLRARRRQAQQDLRARVRGRIAARAYCTVHQVHITRFGRRIISECPLLVLVLVHNTTH